MTGEGAAEYHRDSHIASSHLFLQHRFSTDMGEAQADRDRMNLLFADGNHMYFPDRIDDISSKQVVYRLQIRRSQPLKILDMPHLHWVASEYVRPCWSNYRASFLCVPGAMLMFETVSCLLPYNGLYIKQ